ncbi:MAG TPA: hypothetical protein VF290_17005 [Pyrinomonadaceae bacterium]
MKSKLIVAVLTVGLLSIGAWSSHGQSDKTRSVSYEYQVIADPTAWAGPEEGLKKLNQFGAQGWEITGVVQHGDNPPMLYLKRVRR